MSRISVVIPTYNRAELLRLTLDSVKAQTSAAFEVIVIDDGSTDHTREVCAEYGQFIRYVHQSNAGLSAARNAGIREASGDWIALCDSDDLWTPRKLELQLPSLESTGAGWSITDFDVIDPEGIRTSEDGDSFSQAFALFGETGIAPAEHFGRWLRKEEVVTGGERLTVYAGDAFGMLFEGNVALPSTSVISREVISEAGGFNARFRAEETEFFHRIAARAPVAIVMKQLASYRVGNVSLIQGPPIPFIEDALESLDLALALRPQLTDAERAAFRSGRRRLLTRLAYARLSVLDLVKAREAVQEALADDQRPSPALLAMLMASFLPASVLRSLHSLKRAIRSGTQK